MVCEMIEYSFGGYAIPTIEGILAVCLAFGLMIFFLWLGLKNKGELENGL